MLRVIAIGFVLAVGASQAAPPASGGSSGATTAIEHQLKATRAQVKAQHAHTARLKGRVSELEQRSAAQRAQQAQRDRDIAELRRKLDALESHSRPATATTAPPHSPARR